MRRLFLSIFLFCLFGVLPLVGNCYGSVSEELYRKLQSERWADLFYKDGELKRYSQDPHFTLLVELVQNKGVDWPIRIKGIRLLSDTKNPLAADVLMNLLYDPFFNHECPAIKSSVAEALGNFKGDGRVIEALLYAMNDGEILVREASVNSIGKVSDKRAIPALLKLLNDRSVAMRISAIRALGNIGDASALPYIERVAKQDASEEVRAMAQEAIKNIKGSTN